MLDNCILTCVHGLECNSRLGYDGGREPWGMGADSIVRGGAQAVLNPPSSPFTPRRDRWPRSLQGAVVPENQIGTALDDRQLSQNYFLSCSRTPSVLVFARGSQRLPALASNNVNCCACLWQSAIQQIVLQTVPTLACHTFQVTNDTGKDRRLGRVGCPQGVITYPKTRVAAVT